MIDIEKCAAKLENIRVRKIMSSVGFCRDELGIGHKTYKKILAGKTNLSFTILRAIDHYIKNNEEKE